MKVREKRIIKEEDGAVKDEMEDSGTEVSEDGRVTVVEADVHNDTGQVAGGVDSGTSFSSRENTPRGERGEKEQDDIIADKEEVNGVNGSA